MLGGTKRLARERRTTMTVHFSESGRIAGFSCACMYLIRFVPWPFASIRAVESRKLTDQRLRCINWPRDENFLDLSPGIQRKEERRSISFSPETRSRESEGDVCLHLFLADTVRMLPFPAGGKKAGRNGYRLVRVIHAIFRAKIEEKSSLIASKKVHIPRSAPFISKKKS